MQKPFKKLYIKVCGFQLSFQALKYIPSTLNLTLLTLLLAGCGENLSTVKMFGETAVKFDEKSKEISLDIYNSCLRSLNYINIKIVSNVFQERTEIEEQCNSENKPSANKVNDANQVLITYIEKLGQLADNNLESPKDNLNKLGESLKSLSVPLKKGQKFQLPQADVDAGVKILNFLSNALTKEFRRKQIKQAVLCTNNDIQLYVSGLKTIFQNGYIDGILPVEELSIESYYASVINDLKLRKADTLTFDTLKDKINKDLQLVQDKKTNTEEYIVFLNSTATTHQQLYDTFLGKGKSQISSLELTRLCKDFYTVPSAKQGDNSKTNLKPDEIKNAKEIIRKYKASIEPLFNKHNR